MVAISRSGTTTEVLTLALLRAALGESLEQPAVDAETALAAPLPAQLRAG